MSTLRKITLYIYIYTYCVLSRRADEWRRFPPRTIYLKFRCESTRKFPFGMNALALHSWLSPLRCFYSFFFPRTPFTRVRCLFSQIILTLIGAAAAAVGGDRRRWSPRVSIRVNTLYTELAFGLTPRLAGRERHTSARTRVYRQWYKRHNIYSLARSHTLIACEETRS